MGRASHSKIWSSELVFREWRANPKDFASRGEGVAKVTEITEVARVPLSAINASLVCCFMAFLIPKWERIAIVEKY